MHVSGIELALPILMKIRHLPIRLRKLTKPRITWTSTIILLALLSVSPIFEIFDQTETNVQRNVAALAISPFSIATGDPLYLDLYAPELSDSHPGAALHPEALAELRTLYSQFVDQNPVHTTTGDIDFLPSVISGNIYASETDELAFRDTVEADLTLAALGSMSLHQQLRGVGVGPNGEITVGSAAGIGPFATQSAGFMGGRGASWGNFTGSPNAPTVGGVGAYPRQPSALRSGAPVGTSASRAGTFSAIVPAKVSYTSGQGASAGASRSGAYNAETRYRGHYEYNPGTRRGSVPRATGGYRSGI